MSPTKGWGRTALLLAFSLFFTIGCDRKDGDDPAAQAASAPSATSNGSHEGSASRRLPNVEVLRLVSRGFSLERTYIGHLIPFERVQLRAEIDGMVELADFEIGDEVRESQVLLNISTQKFRVRRDLARSNLELAETLFNRERQLREKNLTAQTQLDLARNQRDVARYTLDLAELDLKKSIVPSPLNGFIKTKTVEKGEFVNKGQIMAEILDLARLLVRINVPERDVTHIFPGKPVGVTLDSQEGRAYAGKVKTVGLEADSRNRSFPIEVILKNPGRALRPGMLARVRVVVGSFADQVLIPRHAILEREKARVVFVARNGVAREQVIRTGAGQDGEVQVLSGLSEGDALIVKGQHYVAAGEPVAVQTVRRQSASPPKTP